MKTGIKLDTRKFGKAQLVIDFVLSVCINGYERKDNCREECMKLRGSICV